MRIKICGLTCPADIDCVNEARPDYCGFIIDYPVSRRSLSVEQAHTLRLRLDPGIVPVGVFVDEDPQVIASAHNSGAMAVAQLHGHEDERYIEALRRLAPGLPIWQAFVVKNAEALSKAAASTADMLVLDSGRGSGKAFDWSLLTQVCRPFFLAGGLDPGRIESARKLAPYGVDLSSGVETDGRKDKDKIVAAVRAARLE